MKKIKLNILLMLGLFIGNTVTGFGQITFFESTQKEEVQVAENPAEPPTDEVPINDFLPLLILGGVAVAYYNRKRLATVK
ncbi:hypothetical protein [Vaginella massiliensis]|uniref:hypothetical protein n=1 Tax=Vaginella massiliensis TaxID=1816680 RepID=UPI00083943EE|nr:hypothetical protein [Vaginella massiliensis]